MNVFIAGATGFIGKNFLPLLLRAITPEDRVFVLVRREFLFNDPRVIPLLGCLEEIGKIENEILKCDYFFHLAAHAAFGSDFNYHAINCVPTKEIIDILRKSKVLKNFIFASSIGAVDRTKYDDCSKPLTRESIPNPTSLYGKSKLECEDYIVRSGIPYTIIRPTWVYGKDMRLNSHINKFVSMVYQKSLISRLNFPGRVSLIHVDDLSKALVNCLYNDNIIGRIYFAETQVISIGDILQIIYRKINRKKILQIKLPRLSFFFRKIHSRISITVASIFLDYLHAKDDSFKTDFGIKEYKILSESIDDVISTNIHNGHWVITGANSGIGYTLAKKLHSLDKKLILIDKDLSNLAFFKNQVVMQADLRNFNELIELTKKVSQYKIRCLINNAGVGYRGSIKEITTEKIKETVDVNIVYPVIFTKLLLDSLVANQTIIVNMASNVAYNPLPFMSIYAASKAFLSSWSQSLSYELKDSNRVITFSPSGTRTSFQIMAKVKISGKGQDLLSPDYVADKIIRAVYSKKNFVILGFRANAMLVVSKFLPRRINIYLWGKLFEDFR